MPNSGYDGIQDYIDQVIDAIAAEDLVKATDLVRGATGISQKQASEMVITLREGLDDVEAKGIPF